MEFSEIAAELYAGSPDGFVARRKELADQAKKAGDKELAKRVGALRRPTKSAWLVNLLAHNDPERIESWLELGTALTEAQQRLAGDQLRELNQQRATAARQLSRRAAELAKEAGQSTTDTALQEVSSTLQAAWTDPELAEAVRNGWVHQVVAYGGFGPLSPGSVPAPAPAKTAKPKPDAKDVKAERAPAKPKTEDPEVRTAREQAERRRAEQAKLRKELEAAKAELDAAAEVLTGLRERQAELSEQLKRVTAEEREQAKVVAELRAKATTLRRDLP